MATEKRALIDAPSLEEILQRHFGLKGNLYLKRPVITGWVGGNKERGDFDAPSPEYRHFTLAGFRAYERFISALYDLANHVETFIDTDLGKRISHLDDTFDEYEHEPWNS